VKFSKKPRKGALTKEREMDDKELRKMYRRDAMDTSIDAAISVYPELKKLQSEVMAYAETRPLGFTDEQMNIYFNTHRSTYRARRSELMHMGLIVDSGVRQKMLNGRNATVWILIKFVKIKHAE
jgi:hypothetical protein